ncbi:MAG TPA: hypothetical protein VIM86_15790 [Thermodesulfobacteriota bacterium]
MKPILLLAGVNLGAVVLLVLLVGSALVGSLSPVPYRVALVGLLAGYLVLWVRVERDLGRGRHLLLRAFRALAALVIALVAAPMVVLTPVFSLEAQLPESAGFDRVSARSMVVVRVARDALVTSNVLAGGAAVAVGMVARWRRRSSPASGSDAA